MCMFPQLLSVELKGNSNIHNLSDFLPTLPKFKTTKMKMLGEMSVTMTYIAFQKIYKEVAFKLLFMVRRRHSCLKKFGCVGSSKHSPTLASGCSSVGYVLLLVTVDKHRAPPLFIQNKC